MVSLKKITLQASLVALLAIIAYAHTMHAPFQWDEQAYILENPIVKDLSYFKSPSSAKDLGLYPALKSRYIGYLSFALNYKFGKTDSAGYHLVNISIHAVNSVLVLLIIGQLAPAMGWIGLFTASLFALHPVQTEAVTYVFQRFVPLSAMFSLFCIYSYGRFRVGAKGAWLISSFISALLAIKSKETAYSLPLLLTAYEFMFFRGAFKNRLAVLSPFYIVAVTSVLSVAFGGQGGLSGSVADIAGYSRGYEGYGRYEYFLTSLRVMATYLRLFVLPYGQRLLYDYPVYDSLFKLPVVLSLLLHTAMLATACLLYMRGLRLSAFGILWFYIALSIESSIIPLPVLISEYRMYMPMLGLGMAVAECGRRMFLRIGIHARALRAFAVTVLMILGIAAYQRNTVWNDKVALWEDALRKSPALSKAVYNLGNAYRDAGKDESAIGQYEKVKKGDPLYPDAQNNAGVILSVNGRFDEAVRRFEEAVSQRPDYLNGLINLANTYFQLRDYEKAEAHYVLAVYIAPNDPGIRVSLAKTYLNLKMHTHALAENNKALNLSPHDAEATKLNYAIKSHFK